jgi:hypothetical protein
VTQAQAPAGLAEGLEALGRLDARTRAAGVPLVVLVVVSLDRAHRPDAGELRIAGEVRRWCERNGIPFVDPTAALERTQAPVRVRPADYHWSAAADAIVAGEITRFLLSHDLVPASAPGAALARQ